ncbi:hypothetical protein GCM10010415_65920 [Streptomyces atrovirens]
MKQSELVTEVGGEQGICREPGARTVPGTGKRGRGLDRCAGAVQFHNTRDPMGRHRGPETFADQVPEHFPVDRRPGHGEEARLITPGCVPRVPARLFRTGLPRGERTAWAAVRPSPVPTDDGSPTELSALTRVAATSSTIRR